MKILIFNTLYYPYSVGGAEKSVQLLAEGLVAEGHSVTVATLHELNFIAEEKINNVLVVRFPLKNLYWIGEHNHNVIIKTLWHMKDMYNFKMLNIIRNRFFNIDFDVVHTNNLSGFSVAVWSWAKKRNIPVCHTARDYHLLHPNGTLFKKGKNITPKVPDAYLFSLIKKITSKNVKSSVSISKYVEKIHKDNGYFINAKSYVVYNSIKEISYTGKYLGKGKIKLGFLGRVEEVKGIEYFLKSAMELNKDIYSIVIAGKGEEDYVNFLSKKYKVLDMVFLGTVDIKDFFPLIDYLIVPSLWHEPMGRVVIEANSYGVPVLGSNRGGIEEIIKDKETGFIFDIEDLSSLKNAIEKLSNLTESEYLSLSNRAVNYSKLFNSESVVKSYLNIYKSTILR